MKKFYIHKIKDFIRPGYYFYKDIFDFPGKKRLTKNIALKNLHEGQRAFLLLTGESLQHIDIVKFKDEIVFGVGFIFLHEDIKKINLNFYINTEPSKSLSPSNPNWPKSHLGPLENRGIVRFYQEVDKRLENKTALILNSDNYKHIANNNLFKDKTKYFIKTKKDLCLDNQIPYDIIADLTKRSVSGGGSIFFAILIMMYMGFKEIYLCGAGYTYQPIYMYHFYDNVVYPKNMGKQKAEIEARKAIVVRNCKSNSILEFNGLFEKENLYRAVCVSRSAHDLHKEKHRILNNYAKSQGVKIYNIIPDGFESPVYEKISWHDVKNKVLPDNPDNNTTDKKNREDTQNIILPSTKTN